MTITKSVLIKNNHKELATIVENISRLYKAGVPFESIFHIMSELPLSKKYKETLLETKVTIQKGGTLWQGFSSNKDKFPLFFLAMINIGEKTGRISDVLDSLAIYHNKMNKIEKSITNALIYPMIVLFCIVVLLILFFTIVIPSFIGMYNTMGMEMPVMCKSILVFSDFFKERPVSAMVTILSWGILLPIVIFKVLFKKRLVGIAYKTKLMRSFNEYISIMLLLIIVKSGVNLSEGLSICCESNIFSQLKDSFKNMYFNILSGKSLTVAMEESKIFSKYSLALIKVGEESGTIEEQLLTLEKENFINLSTSIDRKIQIIGPLTILVIGLFVSTVILIVILPLFNGIFTGVMI